jgi:hypothetical protein
MSPAVPQLGKPMKDYEERQQNEPLSRGSLGE